MSQEKMLTFEEVDAYIEKHSKDLPQGAALAAPSLCAVYKVVRPILVLASQAIFIPKKWRDAIKALISVLDMTCP